MTPEEFDALHEWDLDCQVARYLGDKLPAPPAEDGDAFEDDDPGADDD